MLRFLSREWVDAFDACLRESAAGGEHESFAIAHVVDDGPEGRVSFLMKISDGTARALLTDGVPPEADVVLHEDYQTAAAISRGELTSQQAVAEGRLKLSGDVHALLRMGTAFASLGAASEELRRNTSY